MAIGESGGFRGRPSNWPLHLAASWWLSGAAAALVTVLTLAGQRRDWKRMLWIPLAAGIGAELIDGVIWTFVREGVGEVVAGETLKLLNAVLYAMIVGLGAVYATGGPRPGGRTILYLVVGATLGVIGEAALKGLVGYLAPMANQFWKDWLRLGVWITAGVALVCWQLARPTGQGSIGQARQSRHSS